MEIQNISAEALNSLFGDSDTTLEQPVAEPTTLITEDSVITVGKDGLSDIPEIDLDELEELKPDDKVIKDLEDTPATVDEEPKVTNVLKNTIDFMISKGLWKDFEGREELEVDEDTYAKLASEQFQTKVDELVEEVFDSTGEYGKAIISHIREGGNPDEIIDIFKEQKQITTIDTSTDEGKLEIVGKYYTEILGWKPDRVAKHLKRIVEDKDLEVESSEIEDKYKEYYSEQLEAIETQRQQAKARQIENQKQFQTSINTTLTELNYSEKDKKKITSALLEAKKLPNGVVTTDFNIKFSELQKDPKKLIKLVDFVLDEENFINKIKKTADTNAAAKAFSFIKGNATTSKTKGSSHEEIKQTQNNTLDFSQILKNNK
jgi:hypothetical protein